MRMKSHHSMRGFKGHSYGVRFPEEAKLPEAKISEHIGHKRKRY